MAKKKRNSRILEAVHETLAMQDKALEFEKLRGGGKVLHGLVTRREAEATLLLIAEAR